MKLVTWLITTGALAALAVAPAAADEAKAPITAAGILNLFARPVETREAAFDQALRDDVPKAPIGTTTTAGEVVGEGTVRYGRATITVKNPCPPGHDEPKPLPGRRHR
jgi:hypothetical protein